MKTLKLFLDLDGVFVDFTRGAKELLNIEYPKERLPAEEFKKFQDFIGFKIWSRKFFWQDLKELPNCQEMYSYFKKYDPTILTAYPMSYTPNSIEALTCEAEKTAWVSEHFGPDQSKRLVCITASLKHIYVSPKSEIISVLIDDRPENINDWNKQGGIGILHTSMKDSIMQFEDKVLPFIGSPRKQDSFMLP